MVPYGTNTHTKLPLPKGDLDHHGSLGTQVFIPNGISISAALIAQLTIDCPYTLQWATTLPPKKLPLPFA